MPLPPITVERLLFLRLLIISSNAKNLSLLVRKMMRSRFQVAIYSCLE
jgi:hypothetical protein